MVCISRALRVSCAWRSWRSPGARDETAAGSPGPRVAYLLGGYETDRPAGFLENWQQPLAYAYVCACTALKNYVWVHVRGLNGGWKSLVARNYTLVDTTTSIDMDEDSDDDNLAWWLSPARDQDLVPRPVEWQNPTPSMRGGYLPTTAANRK